MTLPTCLALAVPAAAFAALGFLASPQRTTPQRTTAPANTSATAEKVERTGQVAAWYVFADGTVALRLVGQDKEQGFNSWFITPADKTETTRFEHLMLGLALDVADSREPLTIAYELSNEKLGKTLKDAIPIHAVMWGTTFAAAEGRPAPRK